MLLPAMENVSLWHERDISHSAVERNIGPDATVTLDFALNRLSNVVNNLNIYPKNMEKNLKLTKGIFLFTKNFINANKSRFNQRKSF